MLTLTNNIVTPMQVTNGMENLKVVPVYRGMLNYTPDMRERNQRAKQYSHSVASKKRTKLIFNDILAAATIGLGIVSTIGLLWISNIG